jgi:hypothetical protein
VYGTLIGSPLLFIRGDVCAESNRSCMKRRSGDPCFLYVVMCVLKAIPDRDVNWEPWLIFTRWFVDRACDQK